MIDTQAKSKTITKDFLKEWSACSSGYRWFLECFPDGAELAEVHKALIAAKRGGDVDWLIEKAFDSMNTAEFAKNLAIIAGADAVAIAATAANDTVAATTGDRANAATTGDRANAATTGDRANAATTGYGANAATTGYGANAATTGHRANAATTGDGANAATTGHRANAATTGYGAIAAALGKHARAKAGIGGAIVLAHRSDDGNLLCVVATMVGSDVKPDTWYVLDESGKLTEDTTQ